MPNDSPTELARKRREFQLLQTVSAQINSTLELADIFEISLRMLAEHFGFHHTLLFLVDERGEKLVVAASRGYEGQSLGGEVPIGVGVPGMVAKKRRLLHVSNIGQQRAYMSAQRRRMAESGLGADIGPVIPVPGLDDVESQIAIPLVANDELIGVVLVESSKPREFSEDDEILVSIVANQTASAIRSARLHQELAEANKQLEERVRERTAELQTKLLLAEELLRDANRRVEGPLLGESPAIVELRAAIERCAASDDTVLIVGPHGAGKEATARAMHAESRRARGAFVQVHCAHLADGDATSLFGSALHPSRSDDVTARSKFDLAADGTLYLEGIEELSRALQKELCGVLGTYDAKRQAAEVPQPDVRVLIGAGRDLRLEVQDNGFDLDLHRHIQGRQVVVPSLRERPEDIPVLAEHFLRQSARELGKDIRSFSEGALRRLEDYRWPGNVSELRHVVERAVVHAAGPVVEIEEESLNEGIAFGTYRLVKKIAAGGMGEVWLGKHALLARPAAVKLIRTLGADAEKDKELKGRFRREALVTAELRSPHTIQLYDFGVNDTGTFYYVMELLNGMDLAAMVQRFGPLPCGRVVMLLRQACLSLAEAHEHGLVHRDIKPGNLFVTTLAHSYDFLKVLDFGTVKTVHPNTVELTLQGAVAGTPAYMAPELVMGKSTVDGRADLYSLGCAAYWMLTGRLVFEADNATAMCMHHVQTEPRPPSEVAETPIPDSVERIVMSCLAKDPAARPATASDLREVLGQVECAHEWDEARARDWWRLHAPDVVAKPSPRTTDTP